MELRRELDSAKKETETLKNKVGQLKELQGERKSTKHCGGYIVSNYKTTTR